MTTYAAERKRHQRAQTNRDPGCGPLPAAARMDLELWRRIDADLVLRLLASYSEDETLRILNGPEAAPPPPAPEPFDRSLLAPPGAVGIPRVHRTKAHAALLESGGWT